MPKDKKNFGRRVLNCVGMHLKLAHGGKVGGFHFTPTVVHPIKAHREMKAGAHPEVATETVLKSRILDGPELNILFFGLPFILHCTSTLITVAVRQANAQRNQAPAPAPAANQGPVMRIRQAQRAAAFLPAPAPAPAAAAAPGPPPPPPPLPAGALPQIVQNTPAPAPLPSSVASMGNLQHRLISKGMSEKTSRKLLTGAFDGEDLSDELSDSDQEALVAVIEEVTGNGMVRIFVETPEVPEVKDYVWDKSKRS